MSQGLSKKSGLFVAVLGGLAALLAAAAQLLGAFKGDERDAKPALHQEANATGDGSNAVNVGRDLNVRQ